MFTAFYEIEHGSGSGAWIETVFLGVFDTRDNAARAIHWKMLKGIYKGAEPCEKVLEKSGGKYNIFECDIGEHVNITIVSM